MKKTLSIILTLALLFMLFTALPVSAELPTTEIYGVTYYEIGSAEDYTEFVTLANSDLTVNGRLTADIDLSGWTGVPIGGYNNYYEGIFDGNGHIIKNLSITKNYINDASKFIGMFGGMQNGTIKNLGLENALIQAGSGTSRDGAVIGGIVGYTRNDSPKTASIENCYVKNSTIQSVNPGYCIQGAGPIAGFIGSGVYVINCYSTENTIGFSAAETATTSGLAVSKFIGYVSASASASNIENCYARNNRFNNLRSSQNCAGFARLGTSGTNYCAWTNSYTDTLTGKDSGSSMTKYASDAEEWMTLAAALGEEYKNDIYNLNAGAPRLLWEADPEAQPADGVWDFEGEFDGYKNDFIFNASGGSIAPEERFGKKCLTVKCGNNGYYHTVTKKFNTISDGSLEISFDILFDAVSGENGFASVGADDSEIIKLGAVKGNFVCTVDEGEYITLKKNIAHNKWYSVGIILDLGKKSVTVKINNKDVLETTVSSGSECDNVCFYTKYAPGFSFDNLRIEKVSTKLPVINGASSISYLSGLSQSYTYSADEEVSWSVYPTVYGMTPETLQNGDLTITLGDTVDYSGTVNITAENEAGARSVKTVLITEAEVSGLKITGSNRVAFGKGVFEYRARLYDQYDNELNVQNITWETDSDKLTINGGVVTVNEAFFEDTPITLSASALGKTSQKSIVGQTASDFDADLARWNTLLDSADRVLVLGRDIYKNTPLMASGYDVTTGKPVEFSTRSGDSCAPANLGMDSAFFRVLDRISELSGDDKYKKKVDDIYKWYLENGIDPATKLGYWGGHTFIDLKTGEKHMAAGNQYNHELKNTTLYFDPFYRINKTEAKKMLASIWGGHVGSVEDWATLKVNRHALFNEANSAKVLASAAAMSDLDVFTLENTGWQRSLDDLPFRAAGSDLVKLAVVDYLKNNNDTAFIWAMRLINMYYNCRNTSTGIVPSMYMTGRNAPGGRSVTEDYGSQWYTLTSSSASDWVSPKYGDRFFNQFAEDLVNQGFYDSSALDPADTRLLEGNYFGDAGNIEDPVLNDLSVSRVLGPDTAQGSYIRRIAVKNIAGYINNAWIANTPNFNRIMADGTSLTGFRPQRNGFYGNFYNNGAGSGAWRTFVPDETAGERSFFEAAAYAYLNCVNDAELTSEKNVLESFIEYHLKAYGLMTSGGELNETSSERSPRMLNGLLYLYRATGNGGYLTLARNTADNMIACYRNTLGVFSGKVDSGSTHYKNIELGGRSTKYYDALLNLEYTVCKREDEIPVIWKFDSYYEDYFYDPSTGETKRTWDSIVYG